MIGSMGGFIGTSDTEKDGPFSSPVILKRAPDAHDSWREHLFDLGDRGFELDEL